MFNHVLANFTETYGFGKWRGMELGWNIIGGVVVDNIDGENNSSEKNIVIIINLWLPKPMKGLIWGHLT